MKEFTTHEFSLGSTRIKPGENLKKYWIGTKNLSLKKLKNLARVSQNRIPLNCRVRAVD